MYIRTYTVIEKYLHGAFKITMWFSDIVGVLLLFFFFVDYSPFPNSQLQLNAGHAKL